MEKQAIVSTNSVSSVSICLTSDMQLILKDISLD